MKFRIEDYVFSNKDIVLFCFQQISIISVYLFYNLLMFICNFALLVDFASKYIGKLNILLHLPSILQQHFAVTYCCSCTRRYSIDLISKFWLFIRKLLLFFQIVLQHNCWPAHCCVYCCWPLHFRFSTIAPARRWPIKRHLAH